MSSSELGFLYDLTFPSSNLAVLNIPAVVGMLSYDAESAAGIFSRLITKSFDWSVYQEILEDPSVITCFGLGFLLSSLGFYGIWSAYSLFLAISEMLVSLTRRCIFW